MLIDALLTTVLLDLNPSISQMARNRDSAFGVPSWFTFFSFGIVIVIIVWVYISLKRDRYKGKK